jgi:hypothetical protein
VFPVTLMVNCAAVRSLHDEGLRGSVDADDGCVKLVDVRAGVGWTDRTDIEGGRDHAGDLAVAVDLDRTYADRSRDAGRLALRLGDDQGRGQS